MVEALAETSNIEVGKRCIQEHVTRKTHFQAYYHGRTISDEKWRIFLHHTRCEASTKVRRRQRCCEAEMMAVESRAIS